MVRTATRTLVLAAALCVGVPASAQRPPPQMAPPPPPQFQQPQQQQPQQPQFQQPQQQQPQQPQQEQPQVFTTVEAEDAAELVREAGFRAVVSDRRERSVDLETRMSGLRTYFILYNCTNGQRCGSAQMRMTAQFNLFGLDHTVPSDIETALILCSRWMDFRRYTACYLVHSERENRHIIAFSADMSFAGGVSRESVHAFVQRFDDLLGEYRTFMRDQANRTLPGYSR